MIARPFTGSPGSYERTTNRHDFSLQPRRPNYLSLVREAGHKVYGVGKIGDIFAHQEIDEEFTTKSNVEGIQKTEELLRSIDDGLVFTNLVETDSLWGHRNDPVNFHRCLQDFDSAAAGHSRRAAPERPADPDLRPRVRSDDTVDRSLARARASACLRRGAERVRQDPRERRVRRRRRDGERLARREDAAAGHTGRADRRGMRQIDDPGLVREQYADESNLAARKSIYANAEGADARVLAFEAVAEVAPARVLEVGGGEGELAERIVRELGVGLHFVDQSERMVEIARGCGLDAQVGDVQSLAFDDSTFDCAVAAWMLYHVHNLERAVSELARVLVPGGRLVAVTSGAGHLRELRGLAGHDWWTDSLFSSENGAEILGRSFARVEARDASGTVSIPDQRHDLALPPVDEPAGGGEPATARSSLPRASRHHGVRRHQVIRPAEPSSGSATVRSCRPTKLSELIIGYTRGEVPDYQMAAFCMAVYFRGCRRPRRSR